MNHAAKRRKTTVVHIIGRMRDGGAEAMLRTLVPRLALEPDFDLHFIPIYDSRLDEAEKAALGIPVHEIGRRARRDVSFAPRLIAALRRLQPQIVHTHSHSGKFAGRLGAIAAGVPNIVFSEHGDDARGVVHWSVNRFLNARTARFIVFTEAERQRYAAEQHISVERIRVIPNGIAAPAPIDIALTRGEMGLREGDFAIAIPARLVAQKNQELLLRAVAALRDQGRSRICVFVIGEGPDGDALKSLARELGITDEVRFLGYRHDAQRLTSACDVLALSSRWERMPLVLGEAMLAGVAAVSTPWTGVEAFIQDGQTGYLSSDWTVEAFQSALARSIDDSAARKELAERGRNVAAERFDLDRAVRSHAELYRELASGSQPISARRLRNA